MLTTNRDGGVMLGGNVIRLFEDFDEGMGVWSFGDLGASSVVSLLLGPHVWFLLGRKCCCFGTAMRGIWTIGPWLA